MVGRIKKRMSELNIKNSTQLAKKCGLPFTTMNSILSRGGDNIGLTNLKKILEGLECSFDYLIYGKEETQIELEEISQKEEVLIQFTETEPKEEMQTEPKEMEQKKEIQTLETMDASALIDLFARCSTQYNVLNLETIHMYNKVKNELLSRLSNF